MAKMWRRTLIEDDDDEDEYVYDRLERYKRPTIEARHYNQDILDEFTDYEEDEEESAKIEELLDKVRRGKYKPKYNDHWSLHVAYNLIQNRGR